MFIFRAQKYLFTPILFMGADVNHPDPGDMKSPSIAAVCANVDNHPNRYIGIEMVQRSRMETLVDLKRAVKHSLISYYRNTRLKPDKIIFYRDGVSEGQFNEVRWNIYFCLLLALVSNFLGFDQGDIRHSDRMSRIGSKLQASNHVHRRSKTP